MRALSWAVLVGMMLGFTASGHAAEFRSSTLGSVTSFCSGGCVDTWLVQCPSAKTHRIAARVGSLFGPRDVIEVVMVGFTGPATLVGQADRELSPTNGSGPSQPAVLERPGNTLGAMKALVEIAQIAEEDATHPPNGGYFVDFTCEGLFGDDLDTGPGRTTVKQLQDE